MDKKEDKLDTVVSLCKRRGFVFQGSEIYGGLAGTWDYGHYGAELAHNIKALWWKHFVTEQDDIFNLASSSIMSEDVWRASGHLDGFTDPLIECLKCKKRFRGDQLESKEKCPDCGGKLGKEKVFNLLFPVDIGSTTGETTKAYLRGEIAQGMFTHFKDYLDTLHPSLPFGIAQIGRAYRNEIAPRDFLFRVREFDLMEFEYFINEKDWEKYFEFWRKQIWSWIERVGIDKSTVHELEVPDGERAHYSKRTIDFEFDYPFGKKELYGLAYRTDYDLKKHMEHSGVDMRFTDPEIGDKYIPHVIEPTFGLGRTVLAVLLSSYRDDEINGEKRTYLRLPPAIAPVKVAVFPLLRNKPQLVEKAKEIYRLLKSKFGAVEFDDNGNIGKRYRRQDEIGTPFCITIDFETIEKNNGVTVRDRDSGKQMRIDEKDLVEHISNKIL